jgi:D-alanine-D-alanine ligase
MAPAADRALGCDGRDVASVEGIGTIWGTNCLEVNTQPGMTEISREPRSRPMWAYSFGELVRWMVEHTSRDR